MKDPYLLPPIERETYPKVLTVPLAHKMLGGAIGINHIRELAKRQPSTLGVCHNGRKILIDRDRLLAWWHRQLDGRRIS